MIAISQMRTLRPTEGKEFPWVIMEVIMVVLEKNLVSLTFFPYCRALPYSHSPAVPSGNLPSTSW